jgi:hypothetical protein
MSIDERPQFWGHREPLAAIKRSSKLPVQKALYVSISRDRAEQLERFGRSDLELADALASVRGETDLHALSGLGEVDHAWLSSSLS